MFTLVSTAGAVHQVHRTYHMTGLSCFIIEVFNTSMCFIITSWLGAVMPRGILFWLHIFMPLCGAVFFIDVAIQT